MHPISREVIGTTIGEHTFEYTWRDMVLYALGVGAKENEMEYLYEKNLKAIPTFGTVPYWGTFGITPYHAIPRNVVISLNLNLEGSLHMSHELILHKPIPPMGATFTFDDVVTDIFDRGGKGAVIRSKLTAYDTDGEKVFTNIGDTYFRDYFAPDSEIYPRSEVVFPNRDPDFIERDLIPSTQNLLYRLSGDTNLLHVDSETAAQAGFPKPNMQGLSTLGYACRMSMNFLFPKEPERMKRIGAQMRNPLFPGTEMELQLWKIAECQAYFRLVDLSTGKPALDKGFVEWS